MFKVAILVLKSAEETMLNMSFEMLVASMMTLPTKFLIAQSMEIDNKYAKMIEDAQKSDISDD